ncbi:MAG: YabP/YqfC family sporulation protein [Eubacteriales bacterium]
MPTKKEPSPRAAPPKGEDPRKKRVPKIPVPLTLSGGLKLQIQRDSGGLMRVVAVGIRKILHYSEQKLQFSTGKEVLELTGEQLHCCTYTTGAVEVRGRVAHITFMKAGGGR